MGVALGIALSFPLSRCGCLPGLLKIPSPRSILINYPLMIFPRTVIAILFCFCFASLPAVFALNATGYSAAANDRFISGFPLAPVANESEAFITAGVDLSGVGWSTTTYAASTHKNFALLSPQHFLTAQHYENGSQRTQGVRILNGAGSVLTLPVDDMINLGRGVILSNQGVTAHDLAIGTTETPFSAAGQIYRHAIFDLHNTSGSDSQTNYSGLGVLHYGHGGSSTASPRVGLTSISQFTNINSDPTQTVFLTPRTEVALVDGDSASPAFHLWTNPNGNPEVTLLGVNSAINNDFNFISFLASTAGIAATQSALAPLGRAPRMVGNPAATWTGSNTSIGNRSAWGLNRPANAPQDRYVLFNAATATSRTVNVNTDHNLRGLFFRSTAAEDDFFTFTGSFTLTLGRGGVMNYDNAQQRFEAHLILDAPQYWDAGPGGLRVANLNLNQHLLEIRSAGPSLIAGNISGTGGLALESGSLRLEGGTHSFTGKVWIHEGEFHLADDLSEAEGFQIGSGGVLIGSGSVSVVTGNGVVSPGLRRLSAHRVELERGLGFDFEFSKEGHPDFSSSTNAENSLLYLSGTTPFSTLLSAGNPVRLFLPDALSVDGATFGGGFLVSVGVNLAAALEGIKPELWIEDAEGGLIYGGKSYRSASEDWAIGIQVEDLSADLGDGVQALRMTSFRLKAASFSAWRSSVFPEEMDEALTGLLADANSDGLQNVFSYLMRRDPLQGGRDGLPEFFTVTEGEVPEAVFQFRRYRFAQDFELLLETSSDLVTWDLIESRGEVVEPDADGDGLVELRQIRKPLPETDQLFIRLRAVLIEVP
jgi:hypothetical protein